MELSSNHVATESGQIDSNGRTSLVFSIRGPIPIQLGKFLRIRKQSHYVFTIVPDMAQTNRTMKDNPCTCCNQINAH